MLPPLGWYTRKSAGKRACRGGVHTSKTSYTSTRVLYSTVVSRRNTATNLLEIHTDNRSKNKNIIGFVNKY